MVCIVYIIIIIIIIIINIIGVTDIFPKCFCVRLSFYFKIFVLIACEKKKALVLNCVFVVYLNVILLKHI